MSCPNSVSTPPYELDLSNFVEISSDSSSDSGLSDTPEQSTDTRAINHGPVSVPHDTSDGLFISPDGSDSELSDLPTSPPEPNHHPMRNISQAASPAPQLRHKRALSISSGSSELSNPPDSDDDQPLSKNTIEFRKAATDLGVRCFTSVEYGFGQAAGVYKRLHQSRWQLTYNRLTKEIGAHALVSITLLRTLARFADDAREDVNWADALAAILAQRDLRVRGDETNGSRAGIPKYTWCIPRDVAIASDEFCVSSVDVRRVAGLNRKSRATLPEAIRTRGQLARPTFDAEGEPIWVAYEPSSVPGSRNPFQEKVEIIGGTRHNKVGMWHYLAKSSTDQCAEYTHDPNIKVPDRHSHPFPKDHNTALGKPQAANSVRRFAYGGFTDRNAQHNHNAGNMVQHLHTQPQRWQSIYPMQQTQDHTLRTNGP